MKKKNLLYALLIMVLCLTCIQPVDAATKYTSTEKKLAKTLATFQNEDLSYPESFKIQKIYKVNYKLKYNWHDAYDAYGILDDAKKIIYEVEFTAQNGYGGTVRDYVYITSTYCYIDSSSIDLECYKETTQWAKKGRTFTKHVKALTKKYYKNM